MHKSHDMYQQTTQQAESSNLHKGQDMEHVTRAQHVGQCSQPTQVLALPFLMTRLHTAIGHVVLENHVQHIDKVRYTVQGML